MQNPLSGNSSHPGWNHVIVQEESRFNVEQKHYLKQVNAHAKHFLVRRKYMEELFSFYHILQLHFYPRVALPVTFLCVTLSRNSKDVERLTLWTWFVYAVLISGTHAQEKYWSRTEVVLEHKQEVFASSRDTEKKTWGHENQNQDMKALHKTSHLIMNFSCFTPPVLSLCRCFWLNMLFLLWR